MKKSKAKTKATKLLWRIVPDVQENPNIARLTFTIQLLRTNPDGSRVPQMTRTGFPSLLAAKAAIDHMRSKPAEFSA